MIRNKHNSKTQATLAKRAVKVVPVGAWVEIGTVEHDICNHDAIISAREEEERMQERHQQKQEKLQRFQRDVKLRVQRLHQQKRKQQLQESYNAVELERNVIQQSTRAAEKATSKRNHCLYRNEDLSIMKHQEDAISTDTESEQEEQGAEHMKGHSYQISQMIRSAKHNLAAKQLIPGKTNVPGGQWGSSFTRDKQTLARTTPQEQVGVSWENSDARIPQQPIDDIGSYGDSEDLNYPERHLHTTESILQTAGMSPPKTVTFNPNIGENEPRYVHPMNHEHVEPSSNRVIDDGSGDRRKTVTFNPVDDVVSGTVSGKTGVRPKSISSCGEHKSVPDVKPGIQEEEHRRQIRNQYSIYRRLFMDIEREQVRENIRKKAHQKKINRLKKQKEQERQEVEKTVSRAMEVRDPLTGETETEAQEREEKYVENLVVKQKQQQQKHKETQRYIRALRAMMREKMEKQKITMPPLCACGPTIWDSNPDTCANNCIFYQNPKAYAKALSSLLMSCQVD